ncbi:MAG: dockerin type I domain-containing protein [Methanospirillum sp.]
MTVVVRVAALMALLCLCIGIASAVPPLPSEYHGSVTIGGAPAPANTVVRAVIDGEVKGELVVSNAGAYGGTGTFDPRLVISGDEDDLGKTIAFTVNGATAAQTATFSSGQAATLDLSVAGIVVLAVPGGAGMPADTNGDGTCDDVNGNGRKDFADVVLYFNQMAWIPANEPVAAFDYNGNSRIDFADVVWLFNNL